MQEGHKWLFRLNFFSFKSAWIFACTFQFCKTFPCIFLAGLHFVSEKNGDKISKRAPWTQQSGTRAFHPEKAHAKIQALFKEKKFYPKKSLTSLLQQATTTTTTTLFTLVHICINKHWKELNKRYNYWVWRLINWLVFELAPSYFKFLTQRWRTELKK